MSHFPALPSASFLFGHLPLMQKDTYGFYLEHHRRYGEYLRFRAIPTVPFYSFASTDALHHILITARHNYSRGARWRGIVGYLGGNGLVTSIGEYWQEQRGRMSPYFHAKKLEGYVPVIVKNALALTEHWQGLPENTEINISDAMMFLGLVNVSDTLFGYDIRNEAKSFSAAMAESFAYIDRFVRNPLTPPAFLPTSANRHFRRQLALANHVAARIIETARHSEDDSMIAALVRSGNSDRQLRDEIITLLMAGHDTTATALAWAWRLLATHPDALRKARDEVKTVLKGSPVESRHISQLVYIRMVFEETLRLYPSVWALHRFSEKADEINGYTIKKGCSLALPVYVTHRNPAYWNRPEEFYPEHFDKAATAARPRFAYLPFGTGERVCIGAQLAMTEGILILATLLQHFTPAMKDDKPVTPVVAFTLKPDREIIGLKKISSLEVTRRERA